MIDLSTEFGERVARRLKDERIIWLTTIDSHNKPQPNPVWFLWDDESFLIYSRPNAYKVKHIQQNVHVSLHLDGDGEGGDIVIFTGIAEVVSDELPAHEIVAYAEKYEVGFKRINMSPEQFGKAFSTAIRVRPTKLRGH